MSEETTIARPYARALFLLNNKSHNDLIKWSGILFFLSNVIKNNNVNLFLKNPIFNNNEKSDFIINIITEYNFIKVDNDLKGFIDLLSKNKRLLLIPEISTLYEKYVEDKEQILNVDFISSSKIDIIVKKKITSSLEKKFNKKIILNTIDDEKLLGGAIIKTKHGIIDGTIDDYLNKLRKYLKR